MKITTKLFGQIGRRYAGWSPICGLFFRCRTEGADLNVSSGEVACDLRPPPLSLDLTLSRSPRSTLVPLAAAVKPTAVRAIVREGGMEGRRRTSKAEYRLLLPRRTPHPINKRNSGRSRLLARQYESYGASRYDVRIRGGRGSWKNGRSGGGCVVLV